MSEYHWALLVYFVVGACAATGTVMWSAAQLESRPDWVDACMLAVIALAVLIGWPFVVGAFAMLWFMRRVWGARQIRE